MTYEDDQVLLPFLTGSLSGHRANEVDHILCSNAGSLSKKEEFQDGNHQIRIRVLEQQLSQIGPECQDGGREKIVNHLLFKAHFL